MKFYPLPSVLSSSIRASLVRVDREVKGPYNFVQRERIPNDKRGIALTWELTQDDNRQEISRWLDTASAGDSYTIGEMFNAARSPSGSNAEFVELLANPFFDGTASWNATNASLKDSLRKIKVQNSDAINAAIASQTISLTAGVPYLFIVVAEPGTHALARMQVRDDTGAVDLFLLDVDAPGFLVGVAIPSVTRNHTIRLASRVAAAGNHLFYSGASFARCARVDGASQTGSVLKLKDLPASRDGILKANEYITILTDVTGSKKNPKMELKKLTANLDSDSGGIGYAYLDIPIYTSPVDSAPVMIHRPRFYGIFPTEGTGSNDESISKPVVSSFSIYLEEDLLAPGA